MIENSIFSNLIYNETYSKRALPHLKEEYFTDTEHKILYKLIHSFTTTYGKRPTPAALKVDLSNVTGYNDAVIHSTSEYIESLSATDEDTDWLIDNTEKFCKDKAIYNGIMDAIAIINGDDKKQTTGSIPTILSDALAVSFDSSIGHDYLEDFESRFDYYNSTVSRVPFDLEYMNWITSGGLPNKSLTVLVGGTGTGKTICMCHMAAANLMDGRNVLYVTMEMPEEDISKRIDANLLNLDISTIKGMDKATFLKKAKALKTKCTGKLIVREYPMATCTAMTIDGLLSDLKIKKRFTPDIIYIDYINICTSDRLNAATSNSYAMIKSISEELRGIGQKHNIPIVSATQVNRDGLDNTDISMTNIADSIGLAFTCDLIIGIMVSEEMDALGVMMFKQLKNRHNDVNKYRKFTVGLDRSKMRLYDVDQQEIKDFSEEGHKDKADKKALFDKTAFGQSDSDKFKKKPNFNFN